jgi:mRNA-degrading endonuclease YafQ of YafQ-DinJ toxin-antitoxin module
MIPYYLYHLNSRTLDRINRSSYSWIKFKLKYDVYRANIRCLRNCEYLDPSTKIEELVGIVHFNASGYLSLLLYSIKKFMGDPWNIIIDNGSYEGILKAIKKRIDILSRKIILLRNTAHPKRLKDHTLAPNHLIYMGCKVGAERLIILDQDTILVDPLDNLRSYIPKSYSSWCQGY